jgi:hypothetical protein
MIDSTKAIAPTTPSARAMKAKPAARSLDQCLHRRQRCNRLIGVDLRNRATQIAGQGVWIAHRAHRKRDRVRRRLRERPVDGLELPHEPVMRHIARYADHGDPRPVDRELESLAERVAVAPVGIGEAAAHDGHLHRVGPIRIIELAAADQRNFHRREVTAVRAAETARTGPRSP